MDSSRARLVQQGSLMKSTLGSHIQLQEVTFIDSCMLYNLLLRSIQQKSKNSFIIYDCSEKDSEHAFQGENVINACQYPEFCEALLQGPPEKIKLAELQKLLPKQKQELFAKRMRFYNFIVMSGSSKSQFFRLFSSAVNALANEHNIDSIIGSQLSGQTSRFWDGLLSSGKHKTNDKEFNLKIDNIIANHPELTGTPPVLSWKLSAALQTALKANKINEVLFYKQSSELFFKKYPFFQTYLTELTLNTTLTYPNEVFCGRFFFGNWKHAASKEVFQHAGITHVVNATQEVENYFENSTELAVKYFRIDIEDVDDADISKYFSAAYNFLFQALQEPSNKVLVHCAQGKSRSATIVILLFMRLFEWSYPAALKYVSDRRDVACPNHGFDEILTAFEAKGYLFDEEVNDALLGGNHGQEGDDGGEANNSNDNSSNNDLRENIYQGENKAQIHNIKWNSSFNAEILREINDQDDAGVISQDKIQYIGYTHEKHSDKVNPNIETKSSQLPNEYFILSSLLSDPPLIQKK